MTETPSSLGSFRDPAGFVFRDSEGAVLRQVNAAYAPHFTRGNDSGLFDELIADKLLVPHEELDLSARKTEDAIAVLRPRYLPFITYPYEWCFSQLKDAALLTLEIQKRALDKGMVLKDASAYNVTFDGPRPVFIDTLSLETYEEGRPWIAYRQFCRHFLAPLALMAHVDIRLNSLLRDHIDGVPLDMASRLLPARTRLRVGLLLHIHLHAQTEARQSKRKDTEKAERAKEATVSKRGLLGIVESLEGAVRKLRLQDRGTEWTDYYSENTYSDDAATHKSSTVRDFLQRVEPETVWDLGANTGHYSEVATEVASTVVAMEQDPRCVEASYRKWTGAARHIVPAVIDLSNPSPALGWAHAERQSLVQRGPADAALALALIHHLCIANNVPLLDAGAFFASAARHLVIEFVPKEDEMVQYLLASREDIFPDYHQEGFESAFSRVFDTLDRVPGHESGRTLYLMRAK